jgi:hypothetical protein
VITTVVPDGSAIAFSVPITTDSDATKAGPLGADPADDQRCRVQLWRLGPYIADTDNGCLLGNNGTGAGVYRRAP